MFDNDDRMNDPDVFGFAELRAVGAARLERDPDLFAPPCRRSEAGGSGNARVHEPTAPTGPPKGAMVSHANIMWTIRSAAELVQLHDG